MQKEQTKAPSVARRLRYKQAAKYLGIGTPLLTQMVGRQTFTIQMEGAQNTRYLLVDELDFFLGLHPENDVGDAALSVDMRIKLTQGFRKRHRRMRRGA